MATPTTLSQFNYTFDAASQITQYVGAGSPTLAETRNYAYRSFAATKEEDGSVTWSLAA